MKKTTCEDIGRWMARNHPEIADMPKEIRGAGFYVAPMEYGGKMSVVIFAADGVRSFRSSGELKAAFGARGGFWRRVRDRRVTRMMRRFSVGRKRHAKRDCDRQRHRDDRHQLEGKK